MSDTAPGPNFGARSGDIVYLPNCIPAEADAHDWQPSGLYLVAMASISQGSEYVTARQGVGGFYGEGSSYNTPEVELCRRCGLLRIKPQVDDALPTLASLRGILKRTEGG